LLRLNKITFDLSWHSIKNDVFNKDFYTKAVFIERFFNKEYLNKHILYLVMFEPNHYLESSIIYKKLLLKKICEVILV